MLSKVKISLTNQNIKTATRNNIGDGVPEAPARNWIHQVKRKLTRSGNTHEDRSNNVAPYSGTNGSIHMAARIPIPQQLDFRQPVTTSIDNTTASRLSIVESVELSEGTPARDGSNITDAQTTFQPSLAPETGSLNAGMIAAPDAEDTSAASLKKKTQTPVSSSQLASDPQSSTTVNNDAPVVAQTGGTAMYDIADVITPSSSAAVDNFAYIIPGPRTSSTAVDDIAPIIARTSAVEQESKVLGHGHKGKQNVLIKPASREYEQEQKEHFAKRNVHQALEHHLRGYERVRIAICVDMEGYKGSRRVCVTCYDGAVDKAHDIETILSKNGKSLHGFSYVVRCRKATKIFGYRGSDIDRIGGTTAITSEGSGDDLATYSGTLGVPTGNDGHVGNNYHVGDTKSHECGGTHTYNGDYYNTYHIGADMTQMGDSSHTYNGTYYDNHQTNDIPDGGDRAFSNTPYWTKESTMVEIFCGDERNGNITGAPIRMATTRRDGSSAVSLWTCGGIIRVDGIDYGLTTAHPLVLSGFVPPPNSLQEKPSSEDPAVSKDLLLDNGPFGGDDDFFSAEEHPEKYWQAIGKVSHYALAKMGSIPSNNDWLLFELPKDRSMWNDFGNNSKQDDSENKSKRNGFRNDPKRTDYEYHAESSLHDLAVFTARGTLAAHMLEGTAFLILGNSPFEVLKVGLQDPLRPGDSGSWLMRGGELVGVMIAGSEEEPFQPIGYAISAQEIYRSISTSMGGVSVRLLTALENDINATSRISGRQLDLAVLRIRQLFDMDASVRRRTLPDHRKLGALANIQTANSALTALLKLGFFCSSIWVDVATSRRHRYTFTPFQSNVKRVGEMLCQEMSQLNEGQAVIHLIIALSATLTLSKTRASRASGCGRLLSILMDELNIFPIPAQSHLSALVESTCDWYTLPKPADAAVFSLETGILLARSLGRAMYAIRTEAFFVHKGLPARTLREFIAVYSYYPVITVGSDFKARSMTHSLEKKCLVPRIYIAGTDELSIHQERGSWYDVFYGNVVESDELNDLLEDEKETGPFCFIHDGVYEANRWRSVLWKHSRLLRLPRV